MQPNSAGFVPNWLSYLAGKSQTNLTILIVKALWVQIGPDWLRYLSAKTSVKITCILLTYFLSCSPNLANLRHATQPTVLDLDTAKDETEANQSQALAEARRARRRYPMSPLQRPHNVSPI